jgi:hypothetical protein
VKSSCKVTKVRYNITQHALDNNVNKKRSVYYLLNILSLYVFSKHRLKGRGNDEKQ